MAALAARDRLMRSLYACLARMSNAELAQLDESLARQGSSESFPERGSGTGVVPS